MPLTPNMPCNDFRKNRLTQILNLLRLGPELAVPPARVARVPEGHDVGQHDQHVVPPSVHNVHLADCHQGLLWGGTSYEQACQASDPV